MRRLRFIQFNANICKAAMILVEKEFVDKYDVAILQPYSHTANMAIMGGTKGVDMCMSCIDGD